MFVCVGACVCGCVCACVSVCVAGGGGVQSYFAKPYPYFYLDSVAKCHDIYIFCSKCWTTVLSGVCDVSLIVSHENLCKKFSDNS